MKAQSDNHHWYVLIDGKRHGPLSYADLSKAAREGVVTAETNIWRSGWKNWHPARAVKGLVPEGVEAPLAPDDTAWADERPERPRAEKVRAEKVRAPKEAVYQGRSGGAPKEAGFQQYMPPEHRERRPAPEGERRSPVAATVRHDPRRMRVETRNDDIFADEWRMLAKQRPDPRSAEAARTSRGADLPARVVQRMQVQETDFARARRPRNSGTGGRFIKRVAFMVLVILFAGGGVVLLQSGVLRTRSFDARASIAPASGDLPPVVANLPAVVLLQRNDPDAFGRFKKRFTAGPAGTRDDEILTTARNALRKSVKHLIAISSGDVLVDLTETSIAYMKALQATNPESCVALSDESKGARLTTTLARDLPGMFSREMSVLERVASTNPHLAIAPMTVAEARPYFDRVMAGVSVKTDLQNRDHLEATEFQSYCDLVIAFYQSVLALPRDDKVNLLRHLYAGAAVNADADIAR